MENKKDRWILAPYATFGMWEKHLICGFGSIRQHVDAEQAPEYLRISAFFKAPHTIDEVLTRGGVNCEHSLQIVRNLMAWRLLIPHRTLPPHGDRYARNAMYFALSGADPQKVQELLSMAHIVIIGSGGIGNMVSVVAATAGIGKMTIVDYDNIELSNLTRQYLFTESHVGHAKLEILEETLTARNHNVFVDTVQCQIQSIDDLTRVPPANLWIISADKPRSLMRWVNTYCVMKNQAFLNIGYVQDIAVWGPLVIPGKTGCYACRKNIAHAEGDVLLAQANKGYQAPSCGPINMLAASLAMLDVFRFLGKFSQPQSINRRIGLWSHDLHFEFQNCSRNPQCRVCAPAREEYIV